jgi:hypothetical protein
LFSSSMGLTCQKVIDTPKIGDSITSNVNIIRPIFYYQDEAIQIFNPHLDCWRFVIIPMKLKTYSYIKFEKNPWNVCITIP